MRRSFFKIVLLVMPLLFGGLASAKSSPDYRAGYNDGCSSGKGHYTRSAYKYRHSKSYHSGWRKGKRACTKRKSTKRKVRRTARKNTLTCNTEAPWVAFQRGWDDGFRAAKQRRTQEPRGCAAYRHGWMSGYRACKCESQRRPDSYIEGYSSGCASSAGEELIRDEAYYQTSAGYHRGWDLGFRDCPTMGE